MHIKIDCREQELFKKCLALAQQRNILPSAITITSESLPLGDIILYDSAGTELAIFERKSLADLASSIRDGRYKEQSFRLNACSLHNHNIYYLVEGDLRVYKPFKSNIDQTALMSAMISVSFYKGFSVFRTINSNETADFILQFAIKVMKESKPSFYVAPPVDEPVYSAMLTKRIKKENITPQNIGEVMLSQIPFVSTTVAVAVMQRFGTLQQLLCALTADPTGSALNTICVENKTGQKRKINKTCISNICSYLLPSAPLPTAPLPTPGLDVAAAEPAAAEPAPAAPAPAAPAPADL